MIHKIKQQNQLVSNMQHVKRILYTVNYKKNYVNVISSSQQEYKQTILKKC